MGNVPRNNALNVSRNNTPLTCFNCRQQGHYACNCPKKCFQGNNRTNANLIDWNEDDADFGNEGEELSTDHIGQLKAQLHGLSLEDTNKLADEMGITEDFPSA